MDHPDWSDAEIAKALNDDNKRHGRKPTVTPSMIQSAVYRNRIKWAELGFTLPLGRRKSQYVRDLLALRGYRSLSKEENQYSLPLRRLRQCERLALGLPVNGKQEEGKAMSWEADMRSARTVVDVDENGHVYVRQAEAWELDGNGNLLGLTARARYSGEDSIAELEPNLDDPAELAIWERQDLPAIARRRVIAELRAQDLERLLDRGIEPDDTPSEQERVQNGTNAG